MVRMERRAGDGVDPVGVRTLLCGGDGLLIRRVRGREAERGVVVVDCLVAGGHMLRRGQELELAPEVLHADVAI